MTTLVTASTTIIGVVINDSKLTDLKIFKHLTMIAKKIIMKIDKNEIGRMKEIQKKKKGYVERFVQFTGVVNFFGTKSAIKVVFNLLEKFLRGNLNLRKVIVLK